MPRKLKLWADYGAFPLWGVDEIDNIDPAELPLQPQTINRLAAWAKTYDATLNSDYPPDSGFATPADRVAFEQEGIALWHQLRQELAPGYEVYYRSELLDQLLYNPAELGAIA